MLLLSVVDPAVDLLEGEDLLEEEVGIVVPQVVEDVEDVVEEVEDFGTLTVQVD